MASQPGGAPSATNDAAPRTSARPVDDPNVPPSAHGMLGPRVPRISSDPLMEWEEIPAGWWKTQSTLRNEFNRLKVDHPKRRTGRLNILTDPCAGEHSEVETSPLYPSETQVYEAYLLRVDIGKNMNDFCRIQVIFNGNTGKYEMSTRTGRVGRSGQRTVTEGFTEKDKAIREFHTLFSGYTYMSWNARHTFQFIEDPARNCVFRNDDTTLLSRLYRYRYVDLDHLLPVRGGPAPPRHSLVDALVPRELWKSIDYLLYGSRVPGPRPGKISRNEFSAPFSQLSAWTLYQAFRILQGISSHLDKGRLIGWNAIVRASEAYWHRIPCCSGSARPPVLSSHFTIFQELQLLYSLWDWSEIGDLLTKIYHRGPVHTAADEALAQPRYHACASLPHGLKRLTNKKTTEYQHLKAYLEAAWKPKSSTSLELIDIYSVFTKDGAPNPYKSWLDSKAPGLDKCGEEKRLLWHGTRIERLLGILGTGLQGGRARTVGMFGSGIYLADVSYKSAGYCKPDHPDGHAVLLLCEADVGQRRMKSEWAIMYGHSVVAASNGDLRCIQGLGSRQPGGWKPIEWTFHGEPRQSLPLIPDPSTLHKNNSSHKQLRFNEYVLYNPSHVLIRYVFRIKLSAKE